MSQQHGRIDVHHHILPPEFVAWLNEQGLDWTGGPEKPDWTPAQGIEVMDRFGIATAIASVVPAVYWGDIEQARYWAAHCNEYAARIMHDHPDRYGAMATLALPDTAAACRQAEYALDELKLDAIILFASQGNQYLGDPSYDELMAELDKREAVVLIHPDTAPPGAEVPKLHIPYGLVEFMADTTRAVTNLLFNGVFERYPRIKWIVSHAGATIPYTAWRIALGELQLAVRARVPKGTLHYLQQLYFDTALSTHEPAFAALKQFALPGHVLFGSDYPLVPEQVVAAESAGLAQSRVLNDADRRAIDRQNALELFPRLKAKSGMQAPAAGVTV